MTNNVPNKYLKYDPGQSSGYVVNPEYVEWVVEKYPDMTRKELLDLLIGKYEGRVSPQIFSNMLIFLKKHPLGKGFIACKERMPEVDQKVYYYFDILGTFEGKYYGDNCFGGEHGFLTDDVTHWKPV